MRLTQDLRDSLWRTALLGVLQARSADRPPGEGVELAVNYANELISFLERQEAEKFREKREKEAAELAEVRARFPLGSWAKCLGMTAPVVRVERNHNDEIEVTIFHRTFRGGSGITLPYTRFTPLLTPEEYHKIPDALKEFLRDEGDEW